MASRLIRENQLECNNMTIEELYILKSSDISKAEKEIVIKDVIEFIIHDACSSMKESEIDALIIISTRYITKYIVSDGNCNDYFNSFVNKALSNIIIDKEKTKIVYDRLMKLIK